MKKAISAFLILSAVGCATRQGVVDSHPEWPQDVKADILAGRVRPGMTEDQVLGAWGNSLEDSKTLQTATSFQKTLYFKADSNPYAIGNDANKSGWRECPRGRWAVTLEARTGKDGNAVLIATAVSSY